VNVFGILHLLFNVHQFLGRFGREINTLLQFKRTICFGRLQCSEDCLLVCQLRPNGM